MLSISVITPSYQQGVFIERTIESVLNQKNIKEYFVMDGGSTDNTVEILRKYDKIHGNLHWISEKDNGQAHAVNKGLKRATGDIIGWLNSDDIYYPEAFSTVLAFFEAHPEIDIIYGDANHIDAQDNIMEAYPTESWDVERLKSTCFICQPAVFFRRTLMEQYGLLDEKLQYCMDYEYWLRLALADVKMAHLPFVLAGSRLHSDTKTLSQSIAANKETNDMLKQKLHHVPETWIRHYAHVCVHNGHVSKKPSLYQWCKGALITYYAFWRWR